MKRNLFAIVALMLVLIFSASSYSQVTNPPSSRNRIVRADRPEIREDFDEDTAPAIEILYVAVGTQAIEINQAFLSDDSWLRDLKIGIRNNSPHTLTCVGIAFGLLAEVDTKLKTNESWPWGIAYYRGDDCFPGQKTSNSFLKRNTTKKLRLKPGEQTILDSSDIPLLYEDSFSKMSRLSKAVFREDTWIRFKGRKPVELPVAFARTIRFLEDDSY